MNKKGIWEREKRKGKEMNEGHKERKAIEWSWENWECRGGKKGRKHF
jgi:hypothetical protein